MKNFLNITKFIGFRFLSLLLVVSLIIALHLLHWFAMEILVVAILIGLAKYFLEERFKLIQHHDK